MTSMVFFEEIILQKNTNSQNVTNEEQHQAKHHIRIHGETTNWDLCAIQKQSQQAVELLRPIFDSDEKTVHPDVYPEGIVNVALIEYLLQEILHRFDSFHYISWYDWTFCMCLVRYLFDWLIRLHECKASYHLKDGSPGVEQRHNVVIVVVGGVGAERDCSRSIFKVHLDGSTKNEKGGINLMPYLFIAFLTNLSVCCSGLLQFSKLPSPANLWPCTGFSSFPKSDDIIVFQFFSFIIFLNHIINVNRSLLFPFLQIQKF